MKLCLTLLLACAAAAQTLQIYAIDVEGGKAALFVSPSGQSMLIDAGYDGFDGRDTDRILAALQAAGVKRIDYLVVTHNHRDHLGGVAPLEKRFPIGTFVDHGKRFEATEDANTMYSAYEKARARHRHLVVKAGDSIPIAGFKVKVVTAAGIAIAKPLAGVGQPNPACAAYKPLEVDPGENAHSLGMLIVYGRFRLADLGDLYWNQEYDLACPANKIGTVDVYMTTHHGTNTSGAPQMVWALYPRVAIMNNGVTKGGSVEAWQTIHDSPGLADLWQLHFSPARGVERNAPEQLIANMEEKCAGSWIQLTARADGTFTVTNGRSGASKSY
jgi:competence protein ComEC